MEIEKSMKGNLFFDPIFIEASVKKPHFELLMEKFYKRIQFYSINL